MSPLAHSNGGNSLAATPFERFAVTVIDKVYKLLETPMLAIDQDNRIIAATQASWQGNHLNTIESFLLPFCIEIPLGIGSEVGQLRIYQEKEDENTGHLIRKTVQFGIDQALLVERLPYSQKLKDKFFYHLLSGVITDTAIIEMQGQQLDMNLTIPRSVILVDASAYLMDKDKEPPYAMGNFRIEQHINSVIKCVMDFFSLPDDTICTYMGQGEIAILKATDTKNLAAWAEKTNSALAPSWGNLSALKRASEHLLSILSETLHAPFTLSIGRHHPGMMGLAYSYQDARAALSLGLRFYGANAVYCLHELGVAAFAGISDERIKSDLAAHILSPISNEPELMQTLCVFLDHNCSPGATANRLSIHRNTLNYRLNKISSLTGLDPRQFDDAVQMRLALLLRTP